MPPTPEPRKLPLDDDAAAHIEGLWSDYKASGDQAVREQLILHYSPLVKYVAGRVGAGLEITGTGIGSAAGHSDEPDLEIMKFPRRIGGTLECQDINHFLTAQQAPEVLVQAVRVLEYLPPGTAGHQVE